MDVKNVFLNGTLCDEVYMKSIPNTSSPPYEVISDLQHYLGEQFEMKDLGSLNYFLGLKVLKRSDGYLLSQAKC
ncbi:putative mitochondrial protein [Cucumis melo var. makuwa]|uniref:Mitochondrial protein n=1 Tax=Cucumis melo var. makuwa TaxID=1194695 RepID=A0A5D3DCB0_CUCMM|nr:putative mitochondrial protein [Cucumis melo var. makuwa]TYK21110.1 putative mitochondrial protein [Cucumis melo var. makuwa]